LTESELKRAPEEVRIFFQSLDEKTLERIEINDAVLQLARKYMERKVVGETSFDDCVHIALATINKVDMLVSWNFKHIVNETRIPGYNSVNLLLGYNSIDIRSPRAIVQL
jgi:predicted nucleic acid-binding protein